MSFYFENLDLETREHMLREIDLDASTGTLFISPRIRSGCELHYEQSLRSAARAHDEAWLADQIRAQRLLLHEEQRPTPAGGVVTLRVPLTAADSLASAEFNRFYARGICARALEGNMTHVEVYRAKAVPQLLPQAEQLIGRRVPAASLLCELRAGRVAGQALTLPFDPASGMTIRLIRASSHRASDSIEELR